MPYQNIVVRYIYLSGLEFYVAHETLKRSAQINQNLLISD